MNMRKLLVIAWVAACGSRPAPPAIPSLPGDGDAHVVKPAPVVPAPQPDPWTGRTDLIGGPTAAPPSAVELPKIEEFKLGNGLQVYAVKVPRLPVVALQLAVRAGRMHEPRARLGVSEIAADMLVKGTRSHDAAALARAIDAVGGTIGADSTYEATLVSCSVMTRNAGTCLDLVSEMITQPAFPEAELTALRDSLIGKIQQRFEDPATLASAHAQNLLWGNDHIRGWINSPLSMGSIGRDDVIAWHRAWFVPSNAMLAVTGDIDPRKLRADLERTFGAWRKGPVAPTPSYPEPGLSGTRIRLVDKPGLPQTQIRIAQFGIKHDDPRFFDTLVWNHALGGGLGARLARAVRGDGSKGYVAGSSFDRNVDRGSFVASSAARNADAVAVTKQIIAELGKMAKDGPTPEEIGNAIVGITGGYALRFQAASDFGAALVTAELHGFGQEYLSNYPVAVGRVSVPDAKRAVAEILNPKAYVVVLVGDAKDLEPALTREGWRYEKIAYTEPVSAPYVPPAVPVDARTADALHKLIDDALAAKGGKARLAAIKSFKLTATGVTTISGQTLPIDISRVYVVPDKMRIDATLKPAHAPREIVVSVGLSGKVGWQRGPDGQTGKDAVTEITGPALATVDFERWREPELILLKAGDPQAKLAPRADESVDGKPCAVVVLRSPFGGVDVTLYIDKKTKLVSRMSYSDGGNTETDDFSDYRDVGGLKVAYKRSTNGGGRSTSLDLKSLELEPKIDPTLFDKPAS
jgi:predicted Zn-dependent peptidase